MIISPGSQWPLSWPFPTLKSVCMHMLVCVNAQVLRRDKSLPYNSNALIA